MPGTSRSWAVSLVFLILTLGCSKGESTFDLAREDSPNVVLIVVDALRKDHLQLYGYERDTSPTMDALGASGWVFDSHIASASQTVPSMLSLMLSRYPVDHGFVHEGPGHFGKSPPVYPESFLFLAESLQSAGYATGGFVGNPFLTSSTNFDQGFEKFASSRHDEILTRSAIEWMREGLGASPRRPLFVYLHYMGVHSPYDPPEEFRRFPLPFAGQLKYENGLLDVQPSDLAFTESLYDAGIASVDYQISIVLKELAILGIRNDTVMVVTSDHGDEFLEHGGLGHGTHVFGELVRVPLVISYPRALKRSRRISHLTWHLDLAPTLLELSGVEQPPSFRGHSLRRAATWAGSENGPWRSVYSDGKKLVIHRDTGQRLLFDQRDELDQHPLSLELIPSRLLSHFQSYLQFEPGTGMGASPRTGNNSWSKEELENLRSLGYLN